MKIKIYENKVEEKEIDIEFPIYKKHDLYSDYGKSVIYLKQINERRAFKIHISSSCRNKTETIELELDESYMCTRSEIDYILGRGEYELNEKEFNSVLIKAINFIKQIDSDIFKRIGD